MFSLRTPNCKYKLEHAKAAEPAPETTTLISSIFLLAISKAFNKAAADTKEATKKAASDAKDAYNNALEKAKAKQYL